MAVLRDLSALAVSISAALRAKEIPHALSDAVAMAAHGFVRATSDLDLLVAAPAVRMPEVFEIVRSQGFAGEDRALIESLRDRFVAELRSGPVRVDILVPAIPYHHELLARAEEVEVAGGRIPVVAREDLVVLKLLWRRAKDVPDIHALLSLGALDADYVRATLAAILPEDDPRHAELEDLLRRFKGSQS